jgi:hypothetical protein|tara:strand:+ start:8049 stop:8249 length:201 start_codon:yes stop_codon:yes gene_type:complete
MECEVKEGWREYLIVQLQDLIKKDLCHKEHAIEILELFDEESEDTSEQNAYDSAQQDIQILLMGEW